MHNYLDKVADNKYKTQIVDCELNFIFRAYVKNLVVREMSTDTYTAKDNSANVFEISMPQLSYGFISYLRLDGDYAKIVDKNRIIWKGKEFVKTE